MKPRLTPQRFERVVDAAVQLFEVERPELLKKRNRRAAEARLACYAAIRRASAVGYIDLGKFFEREHSTIMDGVQAAERRATEDGEYAAAIDLLAAEVVR